MSVAARAFASAVRVASRPRVTPTVRRVTPPLRTHIRAMAAPGDEQAAALEAHLKGMANSGEPTLFDKIVAKEIPADVIYEDNLCMAFRDIAPQAKTHFLVIPKIRAGLTQLSKANEDHKALLGHLLFTAQAVAKQEKLDAGFRVVINDGVEGCQSVYHLHIHVLGGSSSPGRRDARRHARGYATRHERLSEIWFESNRDASSAALENAIG